MNPLDICQRYKQTETEYLINEIIQILISGLSMKRAGSRTCAQARAQLSSRARHFTSASFIKDAHPSTKESSHN